MCPPYAYSAEHRITSRAIPLLEILLVLLVRDDRGSMRAIEMDRRQA
jgi:hypothetical protein